MDERFVSFWDGAKVQQFWRGASFNRQDDGQRHSYQLAWLLTRRLTADMDRFRRLVRAARADDAGDAALREVFGFGAGALAATVLGEGRWDPGDESAGWRLGGGPHF